LEEAADLFQKSANLYKMAKDWAAAGDAFERVAQCQLQLSTAAYAITAFSDAAAVYVKSDAFAAIRCLERAISLSVDAGRLYQAARFQKKIAELYETDLSDMTLARQWYHDAAETFSGEERAESETRNCRLKVAQFAAEAGDYATSTELYESIGHACLSNNLIKWSARDYFLRAIICHLANGDEVSATRCLERAMDADAIFDGTPEAKLAAAIIEAVKEEDPEAFSAAVYDHDQMKRLDAWKTKLLLAVKRTIEASSADDL
jgi:alpha-soluble NSF attachment protein